ncbi:MAG: hypothetical protein Q8Q35_04040 [Nanoarchaeota archaeon]|nr:hypothetical protein [Nanoarchaeota archaeon]
MKKSLIIILMFLLAISLVSADECESDFDCLEYYEGTDWICVEGFCEEPNEINDIQVSPIPGGEEPGEEVIFEAAEEDSVGEIIIIETPGEEEEPGGKVILERISCLSGKDCDNGYKCNKKESECFDYCTTNRQCKIMSGYRCITNDCVNSGSGFSALGEKFGLFANLLTWLMFWS